MNTVIWILSVLFVILVIDVVFKRWASRVVSKRVVVVHHDGPRPSL